MGKGSLWRVEQQYKQNLIIALTRSSYHPNTSAMEKATASLKTTPISPESPTLKVIDGFCMFFFLQKGDTVSNSYHYFAFLTFSNILRYKFEFQKRALDAELFPNLSKRIASMQNGNSVKIPATNNTTDVISNMIVDKEYQLHNGNGDYSHVNGKSVIVTTVPGIHTNHEHGMHLMNDHEMDAMETQRNVERIARDWGVDSIDDVNAATAMLALKHGPKIFSETFQTG